MPTGNTEIIEKGGTFKEYLRKCATNFFYDCDNLDQIKNEKNDYHEKELKKAEDEYQNWLKLTKEEQQKLLEKERQDQIKQYEKIIQENTQKGQLYTKMRKEVVEWKIPTPDHQSLKDFMLQQIDLCNKEFTDQEYWNKQITDLQAKTFKILKDEQIKHFQWEINYHTEHKEKQAARIAKNKTWIDALEKDLK